ncbi:DNA cytosine methyltransferase [Mesorhizobium sp. M0848]|uniref:DNA cytosine methyltransferase n=1 Tax=Mesorhizobium sp. M0848 TaxID=2957012 RepID=UPI003335C39C
MSRVAEAMEKRGTALKAAAAAIGVGTATLQNHLAGEHVRSDSARKYENWLAGRREPSNVFVLPTAGTKIEVDGVDEEAAKPPKQPRLVVDIFSGCGGLSLGFDLLGDGKYFRTILALDNQAAPIATLNRNAVQVGHGDHPIGRITDLTEFTNEAEFLTFYLQHAANVLGDTPLKALLHGLQNGAFPSFLDAIATVDRMFLDELNAVRSMPEWRSACERLDRQALNQTSVIGFHDKLHLPRPSLKVAAMPPLLWGEPESSLGKTRKKKAKTEATCIKQAEWEWDEEVVALSAKRDADGRGQLTASARRVSGFVSFLGSEAMLAVRVVWVRWRAQRLALRRALFEDEHFATKVRSLYDERARVSVLVGGPPCQGFSRIGRGKIRSLREARVHVHGNAEAGDARNLLFQRYVMVLGALRPDAFLFENVQHFQSVVKADGVQFQATEVLAEAIANMSEGEATYEVASKILDASKFGIPQTRQRYFMAGVLAKGGTGSASREAASCLTLGRAREAPLSLALAGLPAPGVVGGDLKSGDAMAAHTIVDDAAIGDHPFIRWIRQPRPGTTVPPAAVDAHAARAARADDAAFFALMGPGKRWMDYRADDAQTTNDLGNLVKALLAMPIGAYETAARAARRAGEMLPDRESLIALESRVNGALPLRLLLEQVGEKLGAPHHLLTGTYLAKREGNHGDWVARMDASRPAKTMVSHMGKDTYAYVHPSAPRTISAREAARVQSFPDWFALGDAALTDAFKMVGNAVPPMLSYAIAGRVSHVLSQREAAWRAGRGRQRA